MLYQFIALILVIFSCDKVSTIQNLNFKKMTTLNQILKLQMISAKKVMKIKVAELIKIYNFYFGHFFIRQSVSKHYSQIDISLI